MMLRNLLTQLESNENDDCVMKTAYSEIMYDLNAKRKGRELQPQKVISVAVSTTNGKYFNCF